MAGRTKTNEETMNRGAILSMKTRRTNRRKQNRNLRITIAETNSNNQPVFSVGETKSIILPTDKKRRTTSSNEIRRIWIKEKNSIANLEGVLNRIRFGKKWRGGEMF